MSARATRDADQQEGHGDEKGAGSWLATVVPLATIKIVAAARGVGAAA